MKYYFLNRIAMAVLLALLLFFGTKTIIDIAHEEHPPEKPGYEVAGTGHDAKGKDEAQPDKGAEFILALNKADPAKGEQDVGLCKVCHNFEKGGPNMIGPNLYGIVGYKISGHEGVNYTPGLKAKEGDWTFQDMNLWLENPAAFAAGTSMAFPGIPDVQKRANVIAYLNQNSDNRLPIPEPKEAPAAADDGAASGEGEASGQSEVLGLLATADPATGKAGAALCKVCHTFDKGAAAMVGPNLYNTVGASIPAHDGFNYSAALKDKGGTWTYEALDAWLTNPQAFAPGTTMAFPGIPDAKKRADMIAFLRSKTDTPPQLPEAAAAPEAASAEDEAAPAEEPAAEEPAAEEPAATPDAAMDEEAAPAEEPSAEEAAPEPLAEEPAAARDAAMEEEASETIVVPPTVSEAAPSEPHSGEPASANQPQPVYPEGSNGSAESGDAAMEEKEAMPEESASEDASSGSHMGEAPSPNQPQPAYLDGMPEGLKAATI